ncbi:hypothetical protein Goshw_006539, partial [Gossypium schwendimanii]|nr:hypothetical protein [Gossypium schwendimanii]
MNVLRGIGVPESNILMLLNRHPRTFLYSPVRLKEIVEEVKGMGINSSTKKFLVAVLALRSMSKSTLEKKFDVYRRWGWSDQEIREAFQRYPPCIAVSEDKIMAIMDFLVNKMGYNSTLIAKQSSVLSRSLRVIVPRALFAQELLSQGFTGAGTELQVHSFSAGKKSDFIFRARQEVSELDSSAPIPMFYFIIRTSFVHGRQTIAASQSSNLLIFKRSIGLRLFSNSSNGHSFTVSYLINKCGFSPELASRVSKYVHFETPKKPDSLIVFLENHGFSQTQIVNLIKRQPTLLLSDTEKTLLPKLEFL